MALIITTEKRAVPHNSGSKNCSVHCAFMMPCVCLCSKIARPTFQYSKPRHRDYAHKVTVKAVSHPEEVTKAN